MSVRFMLSLVGMSERDVTPSAKATYGSQQTPWVQISALVSFAGESQLQIVLFPFFQWGLESLHVSDNTDI